MTPSEHLISGKCGMQLVGLKDTFFEVEYSLLVDEEKIEQGCAVQNVECIHCVDLGGMPTGTYILNDMPNVMLSNFDGKWTCKALAQG